MKIKLLRTIRVSPNRYAMRGSLREAEFHRSGELWMKGLSSRPLEDWEWVAVLEDDVLAKEFPAHKVEE